MRRPEPTHGTARQASATVSQYVLTNRFDEAWSMAGLQSGRQATGDGLALPRHASEGGERRDHNILGHGARMLGVYVRESKVAALRYLRSALEA